MNKELIDLQRNSKATCAIVQDNDYELLTPIVKMKANISDKMLFKAEKPAFADKIDKISKTTNLCYFVITNIDEISNEEQERFVGLVKDREINGYYLPNNCIIVFTVKNKTVLKNISPSLYHFAVVAF